MKWAPFRNWHSMKAGSSSLANPIMVKAWFKKAIEDYHSAKALCDLKTSGHILNGAYLAQQCIEKSMKGFLTYKNIRFNKTHHFAELLDLLKSADNTPSYIFSEKALLIHLSDWAISGRYRKLRTKTRADQKSGAVGAGALSRVGWRRRKMNIPRKIISTIFPRSAALSRRHTYAQNLARMVRSIFSIEVQR